MLSRGLAMDAVEKAKSGHPGLPMGRRRHRHRAVHAIPENSTPPSPNWPDRDRFCFSRPGTGRCCCMRCCFITGNKGHDARPDQEISVHWESLTPGHPENFHTKGIETTNRPARPGFISQTSSAWRWQEKDGSPPSSARKVVGPSHLCARLRRRPDGGPSRREADRDGRTLESSTRLIVLYDDNGISIDGPTSIADFRRSGESASNRPAGRPELIDGPRPGKPFAAAITRAQKVHPRPSLIACKTTIGFGAPDPGRHRKGPMAKAARRRGIEGRQGKSSASRSSRFSGAR